MSMQVECDTSKTTATTTATSMATKTAPGQSSAMPESVKSVGPATKSTDAESKSTESKSTESKSTESKTTESKTTESKTTDMSTCDSPIKSDVGPSMDKVSTDVSSMASSNSELPRVSTKPVLVTGATGWIASHVIYQLLDKGYNVIGTIRSESKAKSEFLFSMHPRAKEALRIVELDLQKEDGWSDVVAEVEYIMHIASPFTFNYKSEEELVGPAVTGTEVVYKAAFAHCKTVKRIIHTSSVVAIVYGHSTERHNQCPPIEKPVEKPTKGWERKFSLTKKKSGPAVEEKLFDESEWSVVENICGYEKSKTLAERKAWELVESHNKEKEEVSDEKIELVVMNPAFVFGPLLAASHSSSESTTHVSRILKRAYPFVPDLESEHVDVRDVAEAHIRGMEMGSSSVAFKRFILANHEGGRMSCVEEAKVMTAQFGKYGFKPATSVAPNVLFSVAKFVMADAKAASDKLGKRVGVNNQQARENLGMQCWRSIPEAFMGHALTMMRFDLLERKSCPSEEVENYLPYPNYPKTATATTTTTEMTTATATETATTATETATTATETATTATEKSVMGGVSSSTPTSVGKIELEQEEVESSKKTTPSETESVGKIEVC